MGILFIVALLFAWPTFGLSIAAWILYLIIKSSMGKSKKAWGEYEECLAHRRKRLAEFRANAARELVLIHPDAKLLMNAYSRSFWAYSKSDGVILRGCFNDEHFPALDFMNEADADAEIQNAVDTYRKKLEKCSPNMLRMDAKYIENPRAYFGMSKEVRRELFTKWFWFHNFEISDHMLGARVLINGTMIAMSSYLEPKENGYFSKTIYNEIVFNGTQTENGLSTLELQVVFFGFAETPYMRHEVIFDDRTSYRGERGFEGFKRDFSQIIEFLSSIENEIRTPPKEWAEDDGAEWFEVMANKLW